MLFKVLFLLFFVAIIQSKTLDEANHSNNRIEKLPLVTNSLQKKNEKFDKSQLDALITDLEAWEEDMIVMANTEITSLKKLENSNLKIDKELVKQLIDNTAKLLDALVRVGRAIMAIVKDISPI